MTKIGATGARAGIRRRHRGLPSWTETRCSCGHLQVMGCHAVHYPDPASGRPEPFPTLFWLACPWLIEAVSRLEYDGHVRRLQERLALDRGLRSQVAVDTLRYIEERWHGLDDGDRVALAEHRMTPLYRRLGIGGMREWDKVKCLHLHLAHHLARGSALGALVAELIPPDTCRGDQS